MSHIAHYVTYQPDGRIHGVLSCPPGAAAGIIRLNTDLPALQVPEPANPALSYVSQGRLLARPAGSAVLVGNVLTGVPAGALVMIEDVEYTADGSAIELEFSQPGAHTIKVSAWPKQDQEFTFENST